MKRYSIMMRRSADAIPIPKNSASLCWSNTAMKLQSDNLKTAVLTGQMSVHEAALRIALQETFGTEFADHIVPFTGVKTAPKPATHAAKAISERLATIDRQE